MKPSLPMGGLLEFNNVIIVMKSMVTSTQISIRLNQICQYSLSDDQIHIDSSSYLEIHQEINQECIVGMFVCLAV